MIKIVFNFKMYLYVCMCYMLYGLTILGHIWASGFNLIIWLVLPLGLGLKPPLSPLNK